MASDKQERLLDLVTLLLEPHARTLAEITRVVPGYSDDLGNARVEFHRDKRQLAAAGFPVETVERVGATQSDGSDRYGYRLLPERSQVPDFGFTDDEAAAIRRALRSIDLAGDADLFALWKLGGADPLADLPVGDLDAPSALGDLFAAVQRRCEVTFTYRGSTRTVRPHGLLLRRARWYLSGERADGTRLTYRIDRMSEVAVGEPAAFEPPADWDPEEVMPSEPWSMDSGDEPIEVEVAVHGPLSLWVESRLGPESVVSILDDGVVVTMTVSHRDAFRSWLLGLGVDAEVISPPEIVADVRQWLTRISEPGDGPPTGTAARAAVADAGPEKSPPAVRWLRRVLAMLTYLSRHDGPVAVSDLAQRFGVTRTQVVDDLLLASVCGVPPYGPENLFEITFDEDDTEVSMSPVPVLQPRGPGQLTSAEVVALSTSGQFLRSVAEGAERDLLERALAKVTVVVDPGQHLRVALDSPPNVPVLRAAAREHRRLLIDYVATTSRRISQDRIIDPYHVAFDNGRWYLDAWDHASQSLRRFAVDRVLGVEPTDETFVPRRGAKALPWPPPGTSHALIEAPESARWVADTHPATVTELGNGRIAIDIAVVNWEWLATIVLQIGPGVEVVQPPTRHGFERSAAAQLLARYDA